MSATTERLDRVEQGIAGLTEKLGRLEDDVQTRLSAIELAAAQRGAAAEIAANRLAGIETVGQRVDARVYAMLLAVIGVLLGVTADLAVRLWGVP